MVWYVMPGLPIIQRIVDFGFREPTVIYEVVHNGKELELRKTHSIKECTVEYLAEVLKDQVAPHKPVFLSDEVMSIRQALKMKGIRVI